MKKCPFCAEEIQEAAIKCRHCGSMLNGAAPPAGALEVATVLYAGAPSRKAYFRQYCGVAGLSLLGLGALVGARLGLGWEWPIAAIPLALFAVAALVLFTHTELHRRGTSYRLTTRTIDVETGLLSRTIDTHQLWRVQDVQFEQSLVERMLGLATIRVFLNNSTRPEVALYGIADARKVFDDVKSAVDASRRAGNAAGLVE